MKLTILGVIAVFLAQAGVIAFTALNRQSNAVIAANGVSASSEPIENAPFIITDPDASAIGSKPAPGTINTEVAKASFKRPRVKLSADTRLMTEPTVARLARRTTAYFKPQIIVSRNSPRTLHPQVILTGFDSNEVQASSQPVRRMEKRSFLSKSVSVIKKPYDWLRSISSKLM